MYQKRTPSSLIAIANQLVATEARETLLFERKSPHLRDVLFARKGSLSLSEGGEASRRTISTNESFPVRHYGADYGYGLRGIKKVPEESGGLPILQSPLRI